MLRLWPLLLCFVMPPLAAAPEFTVQTILAALAQHPAGTVKFTEAKYFGVLDVPLESEGTLHFRAPDFLEKHTTAPRDERLTINGSQMRYESGGQTLTLDLADQPAASVYADSLKNLLNGDYAQLQTEFYLQLTGSPAHWALSLRPKQSALQSFVQSITVDGMNRGTGAIIQRITYESPNGDHSILTLAP
ncbi:outer membrane lipoprotein carrier protein LolA [Halothiobacillus sp. DCM-1]|uniref:outer membrane lipoprotein carrier protein LolA n=1 Tax=Halothiobacillus sp. DCM-1 TaxID=3112558 RepID=UPI0032528A47